MEGFVRSPQTSNINPQTSLSIRVHPCSSVVPHQETRMKAYLAEFIGTAILVILGNGVVANVVLNRTKGQGGGWILITAGWGMAVYVGVFCVNRYSGAHLNPAVTIALAAGGKLPLPTAGAYLAAQMIGAILGAVIVYIFYRPHYELTDDADAKLATFATGPAVRNIPAAFICETIGTF